MHCANHMIVRSALWNTGSCSYVHFCTVLERNEHLLHQMVKIMNGDLISYHTHIGFYQCHLFSLHKIWYKSWKLFYLSLKVKVNCFSVEKQKQPILFISKNSKYFFSIITSSVSPQMTGTRGQVNFAYIFCVWKMTFFLLLYLCK